MSFAPEVTTTDSPTTYTGNALRFATRTEAEQWAFDLSMRWLAVRDWRVVESTDAVNYRIANNTLEAL